MSLNTAPAKTVYKETIEDLRAEIIGEHGSIVKFGEKFDIDHLNLYKVFNGTKGQEMSIQLYAKVVTALGFKGLENSYDNNSNVSLRQYLEIDSSAIFNSILSIKFSK